MKAFPRKAFICTYNYEILLFSTESEALECCYCAFLVSLLEVLSN